MKKITLVLTVLLLWAVLLTGCGCKHENWVEANCETPKTCASCGQIEGEALGHSWQAATCEKAKTCASCGKTEGEALGHSWQAATCEKAKTCASCGKTEGEALGHTWQEATTEAPKTCSNCGKTEGEKIITDPRFHTAACAPLFGKWVYPLIADGEMMELQGFEGTLTVNIYLEFGKTGEMKLYTAVDKPEDFDAQLKQYVLDTVYAQLAQAGIKKEDADVSMQAAYGMTVEQYVDVMLAGMDIQGMFEAIKMDAVYYVEGNKIYAGDDWKDMEPETFTMTADGRLVIAGLTEELGAMDAAFVQVTEPAA